MVKDKEKLIKRLCLLKKGGKMVYITSITGWTSKYENRDLFKWCLEACRSGDYRFTQKLIGRDAEGVGTFNYIVERIK
jgi:UDP:flavonoid glycosyltransferase YjiC (YdhE family)